jgi:hypothetical protein
VYAIEDPSGLKRANRSTPGWLVRRRAEPPASGAIHKSPPAVNTTSPPDTSG